MSTVEIAERTGRAHKNILRDARKLLKNLGELSRLRFELRDYTDDRGKKYPMIMLDEDLAVSVITGFDDVARFKVVAGCNRPERTTHHVQLGHFRIAGKTA